MRKTVLMLCVAGVLLTAAVGIGFAIPSQGGPTGIVSIPTAQVLGMNDVEAAMTYQTIKIDEFYGEGSDEAVSTRVRAWSLQGLAGISSRTEAWGSFGMVKDGARENVWGLGLKGQLSPKFIKNSPNSALALGGSYQKWDDVGSVEKVYLTATTDLRTWRRAGVARPTGLSLFGTAGLMFLRAEPEHGSSESTLRPFLGLEAGLSADTSVGAEFRFSDNSVDEEAVWSLVLKHAFDPTWSAEIGTTNASPVGTGLENQGFFVRVGYHFPD